MCGPLRSAKDWTCEWGKVANLRTVAWSLYRWQDESQNLHGGLWDPACHKSACGVDWGPDLRQEGQVGDSKDFFVDQITGACDSKDKDLPPETTGVARKHGSQKYIMLADACRS